MRNYYMSQLRGWTSRRAHWRHVIESGGGGKEYTHPAQDIQVSRDKYKETRPAFRSTEEYEGEED